VPGPTREGCDLGPYLSSAIDQANCLPGLDESGRDGGGTRRHAERTIRKQIEQRVQLNEDQPFSYDRAVLVKMLDEALARARVQAN